MNMNLLCRPLELASIQYAIAHAEFIGYPEGARLYRDILRRYMLCKHPARQDIVDHRKDAAVRKSIADYYRLTRARERAEREAVAGGLLSISFDQEHGIANLMCSQGNSTYCIAKIPCADLPSYGLRVKMEERNES